MDIDAIGNVLELAGTIVAAATALGGGAFAAGRMLGVAAQRQALAESTDRDHATRLAELEREIAEVRMIAVETRAIVRRLERHTSGEGDAVDER